MGCDTQLFKKILADRLLFFCLVCFLLFVFFMLIADYLPLYSPDELALSPLQPPNWGSIFGTDRIGRDLFSRVVYGGRISLLIGFSVVSIGVLFGVISGITAARSKLLRNIIMGSADFLWAFPSVLLAIALAAAFGPGVNILIIALSIAQISVNTRLVFGQALVVKELPYIKAAEAIGANDCRIIMKHFLPNVISPVIVELPIRLGTAIITEAGLSFLGVGVKPPTPSWGLIMSASFKTLHISPWPLIFPGITLFIVVFLLNIIGDRLNNILNPKR